MMKLFTFLPVSVFLLVQCTKKKEQATVSLPYGIQSISKDTLRLNDTLEIKGYYLNHAPINETNIFFNGVQGRLLYMDIHFVKAIVPQTTSGKLLFQQREKSTSINYIFKP
jgi:hypothetical protein